MHETTKMTQQIHEQLSALADGELAPTELALLLKRLEREPELQGRWQRYHLIGDALRQTLPSHLDQGLAGRVAAALADDPAPRVAQARRHWLGTLGGALAAGVALVGILLLRPDLGPGGTGQAPTLASNRLPPPVSTPPVGGAVTLASTGLRLPTLAQRSRPAAGPYGMISEIAPHLSPAPMEIVEVKNDRGEVWKRARPVAAAGDGPTRLSPEQINRYLVNHNEYATTALRGMHPYVRLVGHGAD